MNTSKNKKLTLTVGITTCYGDSSIIHTIKSVRNSKGVYNFKFILIADRIPLKPELKKELKKYNVTVLENKTEASQVKKQKQILKLTNTDLIIFTQDDILLDPHALELTVKEFTKNPKLTMVSIPYKSVAPTTLFENIINVGTEYVNRLASYWNSGDNYLSSVGRFMAFRTKFIKNKFRMPETIATSDAYYYFENKFSGGTYKLITDTTVYFKNPTNMKEHLRKSSRFQYSNLEMSKYFKKVDNEYIIPKHIIVKTLFEQFIKSPVRTTLYFGVFFYTRILKLAPSTVLNAVWEVDLSTKNLYK